MNQQQSKWINAAVLSTAVFCAPVWASTGKLVLTGGVSTVEGAGGGGITPWAFIGTQATENELGFATNLTQAETQDYSLTTYGATVGWNERVEFSLGEQVLDTGITGTALTGAGLDLKQQIVGVKVRVFGDGVLDSDTWYPQVAVGLQHKTLDAAALEPTLTALGADDSGTDFYVTATKLFLKQGVLVNGTLRATKANQNGLLGFGSNTDNSYELMPEISVAKLLNQVQADVAVFGEKDYQQLMVVRRMARDLDIPTEIVGAPTVRDDHGLALSSRNAYLSADELAVARRLNGILREAGERAKAGEPAAAVEAGAAEALIEAGFAKVDYVAIRHAESLSAFSGVLDAPARILAAAWLGKTRLIDNMAV